MDIIELFKDSLAYPLKDADKILFLGVLFIIGGLLTIIPGIFNIALNQFLVTRIAAIAMGIILFIVVAIVSGYGMSIIRKTLFNPEKVPSINLVKNLVSGLKLAVLSVIYYLIPVAISLVVSYFTGSFNFITKAIYYSFQIFFNSNITPSIATPAHGMPLVFIIWFFLSAIFTLLLIVAISRLAETDSLKAALKIDEVFKDIEKIGIGNYIVWAVLYLIIGIVISIFSFIILLIPIIGILVYFLVIIPYIIMFSARTVGLLYNESKLILNP